MDIDCIITHRRANPPVHHQGSGSIDALDFEEGSSGRMAHTTRKDRVGIDLGSTEVHDKGACHKASTTSSLQRFAGSDSHTELG